MSHIRLSVPADVLQDWRQWCEFSVHLGWPLSSDPRCTISVSATLVTEIVRRSDRAKGFVVLPKRWIVERTIGWLGRCRRLAKDWENLNHNALSFIRLASIRLMLRKLCIPS